MILETAKQFVEQTGTNKNQAPYYQAILFIYIFRLNYHLFLISLQMDFQNVSSCGVTQWNIL